MANQLSVSAIKKTYPEWVLPGNPVIDESAVMHRFQRISAACDEAAHQLL